MAENTWFDVMPSIPLARAVPVVWLDDDYNPDGTCVAVMRRGTVVEAPSSGTPAGTHVVVMPEDIADDLDELRITSARVDIEDPQGFAYALRWAGSKVEPHDEQLADDLVNCGLWAWVQGSPCNLYRLKLAQLCRALVVQG